MPIHMNPDRLRPAAGQMIVELIELLGGTTSGGIFIPGTTQDHSGKDTVIARILKVGPPPATRFTKKEEGWVQNRSGAVWPDGFATVNERDTVLLPRDVPLVVTWEDRRYAIAVRSDVIAVLEGYEGLSNFEVIPRP